MSRLSSTNDADGCKGFSNINGILTLCKKESRQHSEVLRGLVPDYEKSLVIVTILGAQSYNSYRSMSGFASALLSLNMAGALSSSLRVSEIGMSKPHALVSLIIACWSGALMAQMTLVADSSGYAKVDLGGAVRVISRGVWTNASFYTVYTGPIY
jgi:hypothetical protein